MGLDKESKSDRVNEFLPVKVKSTWIVEILTPGYKISYSCRTILDVIFLCMLPLNYQLNSDWKWMFLYIWPLYDHFWPLFCHMYVHLSQNWGSDSHFKVLNRSYLWLVQNLWQKTQKRKKRKRGKHLFLYRIEKKKKWKLLNQS